MYAAVLVMAAVLRCGAATYHVDASYDGSGGASDGSETKPFTTLAEAVTAFTTTPYGHTIKVARGEFKSTIEGGDEDFGTTGYNLAGRSGNWKGGYVGWNGGTPDWTETTRTLPDAATLAPTSVTVINLTNANARAFVNSTGSPRLIFEGFVFRDAEVTQANYDGGALSINADNGFPFIQHCAFVNNATTRLGGAVYFRGRRTASSDPHSHDCVFIGNTAGTDGGGFYIDIHTNLPYNVDRFTFHNNTAGGKGGALYRARYYGTDPVVHLIDGLFESNVATGDGGAVYHTTASITATRCRFINNTGAKGGALYGNSQDTSLINCLVVSNTATDGSGYIVHAVGDSLTVQHTTLAGNTAPGGGLYTDSSAVASVSNSIFVGTGSGTGLQLEDSAPDVGHNNVSNYTTLYGGNASADANALSVDPQFVDAANGDYRLAKGSPCVDAGGDAGITTDMDGVGRPTREGYDMGCYEEWQLPVIVNHAAYAQDTEAEVRAEFTYESTNIQTYAYFVIGTNDLGTGQALTDWDQWAGVGEQVQDVIFDHSFSGLTADTTYYFRCVASNTNDMAWGPVDSFDTTPASVATRVWTGADGDGLASNPDNWMGGVAPSSGDYVLLDTAQSNLTWDAGTAGLPANVTRWTQTDKFAATATLEGDFTVTERLTVNGGTLQTVKDAVGGITADELLIGSDGTVLVRRSSTTVRDAWGMVVGAGQTITAGRAVIDGLLSANGQGFTEGQGPAPGDVNRGGSHGGEGAGTSLPTYGSVTNPMALGSGGRSGYGATPGGGAILLSVTDHVTVTGVIGADASHIGGSDRRGAGGSLSITAATLSGAGTIRANGGNGYLGGGGGRVAVVLTSGSDFGDVAIQAFGGDASSDGAAGTIYLEHAGHGAGQGELVIDNNNLSSFPTYPFTDLSYGGDVLHAFSKVTIRNKGNLQIRSADTVDFGQVNIDGESIDLATLTVAGTNGLAFPAVFTLETDYTLAIDTAVEDREGTWVIPSGARLSHSANGSSISRYLDLTVSNLTVASGGEINVDAKGYLNGAGPSPGTITIGACHGGQGAASGGATYGSILNPLSGGSAGRTGTHYGNLHGGGVINLAVGGALINDGDIFARGSDKGDRDGAGGSIQIRTGTLSGGGSIDARGSNAYRSGGGGRVAVKLTGSTHFGSVAIHAYGGTDGGLDTRAAAGTVYKETVADGEGAGIVIIDNNGEDADTETTSLPASSGATEDLLLTRWIVQNYGEVKLVDDVQVENLTLNANGYLDLNGFTVTVTTLTIDGDEVRWGDYQAGDPALGSRVTDAVGGGWVKIPPPPPGSLFIMR